jgi:hypothetical protein
MDHIQKINEDYNSAGQSSIEFLFSFSITFIFIMLFVSLAMNLTSGYMVHLATYNASRVYLVYDRNTNAAFSTVDQEAEKEAEKQFYNPIGNFLKEMGAKIGAVGELKFNSPDSASRYEFVGAYFKFKKDFSYVPFMSGGDVPKLDLESQSYIGREPTRLTCLKSLQKIMSGKKHSTMYDNGC